MEHSCPVPSPAGLRGHSANGGCLGRVELADPSPAVAVSGLGATLGLPSLPGLCLRTEDLLSSISLAPGAVSRAGAWGHGTFSLAPLGGWHQEEGGGIGLQAGG